ncbi:MAG: hypothetical protein HOL01_22680 [Planctomycetaceae bacterium]|nr:hypothetical protein [Planctomycetaceae bacterium]MBT6497343.1 hypothetical protein [Planctomycetaceae bacterium]
MAAILRQTSSFLAPGATAVIEDGPQESRVLDVVPDRTKEAVDAIWNTLAKEQCASIDSVSTDKSPRPPTDEGGRRSRAVVSSMHYQPVETNAPQA